MNMRTIKFRAWLKKDKKMEDVTSLHMTPNLIYISDENISWTSEDIELMQFTGLLDKNDKEIFEGDIIEIRGTYYDTRREPVIFDMHAFMAGGRFLADFGKYFSLEVIGNIYETPELIAQ